MDCPRSRFERCVFLTLTVLLTGCLTPPAKVGGAPVPADLGVLEFPNSGSKEAQESFMDGLLLLHSFEYEDSRESFQRAREIDPDFAMAYWGEAMTHNYPIWRYVDLEAARSVLNALAPSAALRQGKARTPREKDFLSAVEVLYGPGSKLARDIAYSEAMGRMAAQYPRDLESRSFYALSILGTAQGKRDPAVYMRAAAAAEEVYRVDPEHPGALHYLIHSYDDPVHAPLGLRAAAVYAEVAPAASHAQHMISHIYVALGYWDETVDANEKAVRVSEQRAKRKGLPDHRRSHHALHWLQYGYLQQGRYREANELMEIMGADAESSGKPEAHEYYAAMRAGMGVETRQWGKLAEARPTAGMSLAAVASDEFATGWAALRAGEIDAAKAALDEMAHRRAVAEGEVEGHAGCATPMNDPIHSQASQVLEAELAGLIALETGNTVAALLHFREATELEDEMPFAFGPPVVVKPSHELLGEVLLGMERPDEALAEFNKALERAPRRALSLLGKARSAEKLDRQRLAEETWASLRSIWHRADEAFPERNEVVAQ